MAQDPPFDAAYLVHLTPEANEWKDADLTAVFNQVPSVEEFGEMLVPGEKTLVVLDDLSYESMPKPVRIAVDNLVRYVSSHMDVCVCVTAQNFFGLPAIVRKMSSVFFLWAGLARHDVLMIENRLGLDREGLLKLHSRYPKRCIVFDYTHGSPFPLRVDLFTPISR